MGKVTRVDGDVAGVLEHALICHGNHPDTFKECITENIIMRFGTIPLDSAVDSVSRVLGADASLSGSQKNVLWQDYLASLNRKGLVDNYMVERLTKIRRWTD